jgi:dipeptidase E
MWAYSRPVRCDRRQIVAFGGGGFSMERGNTLLDDYVLGLAGAERPKVCFLPTASGDADH